MEPSSLRLARLARNWTLEDVVEEIDLRTPGAQSGVTASMVSGWELNHHATSMGHRKTLCEIYEQPPGVLFAHQGPGVDEDRTEAAGRRAGPSPCAAGNRAGGARVPGGDGTRSRDVDYLAAIENMLEQRPTLVHCRILFGPPFHQVLRDHLIRLLELRDPDDRAHGMKTLHIGLVEDRDSPERFFCASERSAVVPIPSLTSHEAFDSGIGLGRPEAGRLLDHGRQAYAAARRIETPEAVQGLDVVRKRDART